MRFQPRFELQTGMCPRNPSIDRQDAGCGDLDQMPVWIAKMDAWAAQAASPIPRNHYHPSSEVHGVVLPATPSETNQGVRGTEAIDNRQRSSAAVRGTTMHRRCIAERSADKCGCAGHLRNTGCFI